MAAQATLERVVDADSGEVIREVSRTTEVIPSSSEPDYVKLYVKAWCEFKDIKGINSAFLVQLLPYMTYARQGQVIFLAPLLKREIAEQLGWAESDALNRCNKELKKLVKCGILSHVGTNAYAVNPELVGKGNWADIKTLRATFSVMGPDAGTVQVVTE